MKGKLKDYKNYILPFLLSIVATYWSMSALFDTFIIAIPITILLANIFLFIVCIYVKDNGIKGGVVFTIISIIYISVAIIVMNLFSYIGIIDYVLWFMRVGTGSNTHVIRYYYGTTLLASYFFSCTIFYFTRIKFRISGVFLISIAPLIIQSTRTDSRVEMPFVIFLILFFLLYIDKTRREGVDGQKENYFKTNKWYLSSIVVFVLISVLFSIILPKPNTIPKLASLNRIISQSVNPRNLTMPNIMQNDEVLKMFNPMDFSRNRYIGAMTEPLTEHILFEVEAQEPLYLKIGSWDKYQDNQWLIENESLADGYHLEKNIPRFMQLDVIIRLIERLDGADEKLDELTNIAKNKEYTLILNEERKAVITSNYPTQRNFMTAARVSNVELTDGRKVYTNELGFCFLSMKEDSYKYNIYAFNYLNRNLAYLSTQFQIMKLLNKDMVDLLFQYKDYILEDEVVEILRYEEDEPNFIVEEKKILDEAIEEMSIAYDSFTSLPKQLPKRIYTLAEEIVAGKTSDYEKAVAIERYFHTQEFVYDLSPPRSPKNRDYIDYFIFESKKGICIHYATAMVILARAAGLPARYVEGYVAKEIDTETGRYIVRQKDGHAFPEVYIVGYGWMIFEPTVANEEGVSFLLFLTNIKEMMQAIISRIWLMFLDTPLWIKLSLIPYLIFMFWVFVKIFIYISYSLWKKKVYNYNRKEAIESIFRKTEAVLKKIDVGIKKHETPSNYADRLFKEQSIDIYSLVNSLNKSKYGAIEPTKKDIETGVNTFKEIKNHVKRNSGKIKAIFI